MVLRSLQSFGRIDAESDDGLSEFFVETPAYVGIENQRRMVVTGRKGSGKTAIYKTLLSRSKGEWGNFFAVGLDFGSYPWDVHDAAAESPSAERYSALWQFLILVELSKLVVRTAPRPTDRDARRTRRKLKRFIKRNWGGLNAGVGQTFSHSSYKLNLEPKAFGFSLGSFQRERVPREKLATSLSSVNDWLRSALAQLIDRESFYFVLFDDLDSGFKLGDRAAHDRLIGLLVAAREVRLWSIDQSIPFTPVVFMRSDIYAVLQFPEKNKITTEMLERIAWSEDEAGSASLKGLINQRIEASIDYATTDPWNEIFEDTEIDGQSIYRYMAAHTHRRPRDMIRLANASLETANAEGAPRIGPSHVIAALSTYSRYLLDEIGDVAHQSVADWEESLMPLRRLGTRSFTRDAFDAEHARSNTGTPPQRTLHDLYAFGVVGYLQNHAVVYYHHNDARVDAAASQFEVHPGLCPALELSAA